MPNVPISVGTGDETENRTTLACVISWADDGAVKVGLHGVAMNFRKRQRWACALIAGTFVATLLVWADSAAAGCGDYVIFRPQAGGMPIQAASLLGSMAEQILPSQPPCHGPLCRGNKPVDPVPTPPTPQQIDQRPLALLAGGAEVECPFLAGAGWPRLDESPLDGFGQSLLRPPCA